LQQARLPSDRGEDFAGSIFAKCREDGKFILVPPEKVERNR
jgi:hypothetical protein